MNRLGALAERASWSFERTTVVRHFMAMHARISARADRERQVLCNAAGAFSGWREVGSHGAGIHFDASGSRLK